MMTKEKQKKIGTIAAAVFLAVIIGNAALVRNPMIDVIALLALVVVGLATAALYIRDNAPLPRREMMKEFALIFLILILVVFAIPAML